MPKTLPKKPRNVEKESRTENVKNKVEEEFSSDDGSIHSLDVSIVTSDTEFTSEDEIINAESSSSRVTLEKLVIVWKISNYSFLDTPMGKCIESSKFYSKNNKDISWNLYLYPQGYRDPDYLAACLRIGKLEKTEVVMAEFNFFFVDSNNKNILIGKSAGVRRFKSRSDWGFTKAYKIELLKQSREKFLSNDELKIVCEIEFGTALATSLEFPETIQITRKRKRVSKPTVNLNFLHQSDRFSDLVLVSDQKTLKVHRNILAAASPVFCELLHCQENDSKAEIEFNDISFPVLQELIRYIYTNKVEESDDTAGQLIVAANKYCIHGLKKLSEKILCERLNLDNIFDMLIIANINDAKKLQNKVVRLFRSKKKILIKTAEYKQMLESNPRMIAELYTILANAE